MRTNKQKHQMSIINFIEEPPQIKLKGKCVTFAPKTELYNIMNILYVWLN